MVSFKYDLNMQSICCKFINKYPIQKVITNFHLWVQKKTGLSKGFLQVNDFCAGGSFEVTNESSMTNP